MVNPTSVCDSQFAAFRQITGPDLIFDQSVCAHSLDT